jgi:threonine/homoserine/homoserine lactone efflux protein
VTTTSALLGFALVAGLLTVTPGLDTALVLRAALTQDTRRASATAAGICAGLLVWGVAAAVGVSALLAASTVAYHALRLVGAAYLVWLGLRLLLSAWTGSADGRGAAATGSAWQGFRRGLLTNVLNPKIGVFYVAVLPQFLPEDVPAVARGALLATTHVLLSSVWFALLVLAAGRMRALLARPRVQRGLDGGTGLVLVGSGLRLGLVR